MHPNNIIDGKAIAENIRNTIAFEIAALKAEKGIIPGLAVILVGDNKASHLYVRNKISACKKVGINLLEHYLPSSITEEALCSLIKEININPSIHGILVQLPLPEHINPINIINTIDPKKDVDGFTATNFGKLITAQECFVPCTPQGCLMLIKTITEDLRGMNALVIGRSNIVGKPMSYVLLQENCTVTIAHSYSKDLPSLCKGADILVAAVGNPGFIKGDWVKLGAIVIDVGISYTPEGKIQGDVEFSEAIKSARAITPVPGGVGPMTVTCLLKNTLKAAQLSH